MNDQQALDTDRSGDYRREADLLDDRERDWEDDGTHASAGDIVAVASELVEYQLRTRPIPTLLAALAAGWLVGRILR